MTGRHTSRRGPSRDQCLCLVAALSIVGLVVIAFIQPPAEVAIIVALGTTATTALGRLSGANAPTPPGEASTPPAG